MTQKTKSAPTYVFGSLILFLLITLFVPMPPAMLDVMLSVNVIFSLITLLLSITVAEPLDFAAFAPTLVIATIFRMGIDISATRLILAQGHTPGGVGSLIPASGVIVEQGNVIVGIVVVALLVAFQFIVVAAGAGRVAEVAARFTLDAMPGKQMAIDGELHSGSIDAATARTRRATVQKEADFFASMDGAGKYVKGDAIVTLIVLLVSLLGGILGGLIRGMDPGAAFATYALLSVGATVLTAVPSMVMSLAMAFLATRVAAEGSLGSDVLDQIVDRHDVLQLAGFCSIALALVPIFPHIVFLSLGVFLLVAARYARTRATARAGAARAEADLEKRRSARRPEQAFGSVGVDVLAIEIGTGLGATLLRRGNVEALLDRIGEVRRELAKETGIVIPGVQIRDSLKLEPDRYIIRVRDEAAATGMIPPDRVLAVGRPELLASLPGESTSDPIYDLNGRWVDTTQTDAAIAAGLMVFDPVAIMVSHLAETTRARAALVFGRQELQTLLDHLKVRAPALVKDVGGDVLPLSLLHKTLSSLLRERVWPRDPLLAIETIADAAVTYRDPRDLTEAARKVLVPPLLRQRGVRSLSVIMLDPEFEFRLSGQWLGNDASAAPDPRTIVHLREEIERYVRSVPRGQAALVCTAPFRRTLFDLIERFNVPIAIYAFGELPSEIDVRPTVVITDSTNASAAEQTALVS